MFRVPDESSASSKLVQEMLEAHEAVERARSWRTFLAHLLAVGGVILWVVAKWPHLLGRPGRPMVLFFWLTTFLHLLGVAAHEWLCYRRRDRCQAALRELAKD